MQNQVEYRCCYLSCIESGRCILGVDDVVQSCLLYTSDAADE